MASRKTRHQRAASPRDPQSGPTRAVSRRAMLAAERDRNRRAKKRNAIITGVVAAALAVVVGVGAVLLLRPAATPAAGEAPTGAAGLTVREDSRRLNDPPGAAVTFVEFLDFECEACGAAYPAIEQLRQTYGDRVEFVARYFPLDGHFNADRAARAVEAAAQQGKFEAMYQKMYQTQKEWAEQKVPKDDLFRSYAEQLSLDVAKWEADYASPATKKRIQADIDDGTVLGVASTPSFFVNGQRIQPKSIGDLTAALDQALAAQ